MTPRDAWHRTLAAAAVILICIIYYLFAIPSDGVITAKEAMLTIVPVILGIAYMLVTWARTLLPIIGKTLHRCLDRFMSLLKGMMEKTKRSHRKDE